MHAFLNKNKPLLYSFLSIVGALCCYLAWPPMPIFPLIFIAFIPLLYIEENLSKQTSSVWVRTQIWLYALLFFLIWNISTTWWIKNAAFVGVIAACLANALLMSMAFLLYHQTKQKLGNYLGYWSFVLYWIGFEYIHQQWELAWPWLNLGNVFAMYPKLIQWYEYTGATGGTLWVLLMNLCLFLACKNFFSNRKNWHTFIGSFKWAIALFVTPILCSLGIHSTYIQQGNSVELVVLQPNINPYAPKVRGTAAGKRMSAFLQMSEQKISDKTSFLLWPETALPNHVWLNNLNKNPRINQAKLFLDKYPNLSLVTGLTSLKQYPTLQASPTARPFLSGKDGSYDTYNSALLLDNREDYQLHHKSCLVPGVERVPYQTFWKKLGIQLDLFGGLASANKPVTFFNADSIGIAPVICYESDFGAYVRQYVLDGATLIFILTNDAWWGNTSGHLQHFHYARIRAIELRRSVARAANTGVSCFIDQWGHTHQEMYWGEKGAIKTSLLANKKLTVYARYGDYLSRIAGLLAIILLLYTLLSNFTNHKLSKRGRF